MRTLTYPAGGTPRTWGRIHGEAYRGEIHALAQLRWYLTEKVGKVARADAERLATLHLPVLAAYDPALSEELLGIAEGAALRPEDVVVVNHYTDLRDIDPSFPAGPPAGGGRHEGGGEGCSAFWTQVPAGPVMGQTWDMHASAMPYVMTLEVPSGDGPAAQLFTLTGCLGMCGMNAAGVAIAINNLVSTDARVGLVWPALIRRALREATAARARDLVLAAPLGSGHHYLVADRTSVFGIEASGTRRAVVFDGSGAPVYVHTNHCLDAEVAACSRVPAGSTTHERYDRLRADLELEPPTTIADAFARLGSHEGYPRSICANLATPEQPHLMATCGAVAMSPSDGIMLTVHGFTHNVAPAWAVIDEGFPR